MRTVQKEGNYFVFITEFKSCENNFLLIDTEK